MYVSFLRKSSSNDQSTLILRFFVPHCFQLVEVLIVVGVVRESEE